MALTLGDILDQFRLDVEALPDLVPALVGAYCTYSITPVAKVQIWTLLNRRDLTIERRLAGAERRLRVSFPQVRFDFTTIHLNGRDPRQFVPEGAIKIKVADPGLEEALRYGGA